MSIKRQPKSDKHPYASPTTPGLHIAFRDFIIELVCLNVNPKIGPRFWSDKNIGDQNMEEKYAACPTLVKNWI